MADLHPANKPKPEFTAWDSSKIPDPPPPTHFFLLNPIASLPYEDKALGPGWR